MKRIIMVTLFCCFFSLICCNMGMAKTDNKVKLNKTKVTIKNGTSVCLKLKNSKKKVKWSSEDADIATVNSRGKVTGKHLGSITITARAGKKTYKCKVTVKTNLVSDKIKVKYKNDVFTGSLLSQIKEFQIPSTGKVVRNKAAIKKIFSMFSVWKMSETTTPKGLFANTPDTPPEKLLIGAPVSMIFVLKNKECMEVEISSGQVRISKYDSLEKKNCTFVKLYDLLNYNTAFVDDVAEVAEENQVVYLA